jgi:DNA-binding HxlR family transcriptional regulator
VILVHFQTGAPTVLRALLKHHKNAAIKKVFRTMHKKWQKTVIRNLRNAGEDATAALLEKIVS